MSIPEPSADHNEPGYYNRIAGSYDSHRSPRGPHVAILHRLAKEADAARVLEIGPGTGNSALAFRQDYEGLLFGLDQSLGMLRDCGTKPVDMHRCNGTATAIPFANDSFDFIFAVLAIHHVTDLDALTGECYRVLNKGACGFATAPRHFIDDYPLNSYFPSFAEIDRIRFQHEDIVARSFSDAGFSDVDLTYVKRGAQPIDKGYVKKVEDRFISTYALIPDDEFSAGLARLKADVARDGCLARPMVWESVVISAWKR